MRKIRIREKQQFLLEQFKNALMERVNEKDDFNKLVLFMDYQR